MSCPPSPGVREQAEHGGPAGVHGGASGVQSPTSEVQGHGAWRVYPRTVDRGPVVGDFRQENLAAGYTYGAEQSRGRKAAVDHSRGKTRCAQRSRDWLAPWSFVVVRLARVIPAGDHSTTRLLEYDASHEYVGSRVGAQPGGRLSRVGAYVKSHAGPQPPGATRCRTRPHRRP